ncbi:uncharacterized protein VICG_01783 [Vittaforma corneae ATCC 50505]|uniref:HIT domain-containing protein n=1 Tax=Vittaforma corneae (strain ATCC 50505) TaxID=993615 RepID=L2GKN9_VITCO|nr:uncharacterized protein VICG_01783 [Vittaforma corneae ATCC 50505]ELA41184.1 hypothetical protein VICG_01783 [Vittaforma corneae ATCC 50505]
MDSKDCLFCKLKNVTENIVYQTEDLYVIVDRYPMSNRHLLVIPKQHSPVLHMCEDSILAKLLVLAKTLALRLKMEKYNIIQNNINQQLVPHVHLHLVECNSSGSFKFRSYSTIKLSDEEYSNVVKEVKELLNK